MSQTVHLHCYQPGDSVVVSADQLLVQDAGCANSANTRRTVIDGS